MNLNQLVTMAYETAKANGWHDLEGRKINEDCPETQIAGLFDMAEDLTDIIEEVRRHPDDRRFTVGDRLSDFANNAVDLRTDGLEANSAFYAGVLGEEGAPLLHSKTRALAQLMLLITEIVEAGNALKMNDPEHLEEELADVAISLGVVVACLNASGMNIDLERGVTDKNERNKQRGYRHGGKRA